MTDFTLIEKLLSLPDGEIVFLCKMPGEKKQTTITTNDLKKLAKLLDEVKLRAEWVNMAFRRLDE